MTTQKKLMTNWRWWMVVLLFIATTVNYMDRQVLSLTWKDFIAPEFHWNDNDYGTITARVLFKICPFMSAPTQAASAGDSGVDPLTAAGRCRTMCWKACPPCCAPRPSAMSNGI